MKDSHFQITRLVAVFLTAAVVLTLSGCYEKPAEVKLPPTQVKTAKVQKQDIQLYTKVTGKTDMNPVNIVPQIRGIIEEINFEAGDIIKAGTVLFEIDKFDYVTALDAARANLETAEANVEQKKAEYERVEGLFKQGVGFATQSELDKDLALYKEAIAGVDRAKSNLANAQKQLERCSITAPVTGKISRAYIEKGNLVDGTVGTTSPLAVLQPMDPMYVYFQVTDAVFDQIHHLIHTRLKELLGDQFDENKAYDNAEITELAQKHNLDLISFEMGLRTNVDKNGEPEYPYKGYISYSDPRIDSQTGTITIRGDIANPAYLLYPGYICNVRIPQKEIEGAILVEEKAICYDLSAIYVWVVNAQGKPERRDVVLGEPLDKTYRVIQSGLDGSETYIVEGALNLREGGDIVEASGDASTGGAPSAGAPSADAPAAK